MNRLSSLIKTARTPMTGDEKGAIRHSARMGLYIVAQVIAFIAWLCVDLWIATWAALVVMPNLGRFVQNGLKVTSENAPSSEVYISHWVAPMLLLTIVMAAGVVSICMWLWRVRSRGMSVIRRWVDRAVSGEKNDSNDDTTAVVGEVDAPMGMAKQSRSRRQRSRKKK